MAAAFLTPAGLALVTSNFPEGPRVIGVDTILSPTVTPWLVNRFGTVRVLVSGIVSAALAYALFLPVAPDWTYAAMLPSMLLLGLAFALSYGPLTMAATDGVNEQEHGLAGGLLYTSMQFGMAIGVSAVTAMSVATAAARRAGRPSVWRESAMD